jgi:rubrerythrin
MSCGFTDLISGTSLTRRKNGCKKCTKAAPWIHRVEELSEISKSKNLEVLKNNGVGKDILLKCTICHTEFFRAFSTLVYKKTTECPSCHPPKVYGKLGITSIIDNIEFDSNLEKETYLLLKHSGIF